MVIPRSPEPETSLLDDLTDEQRRGVEKFAQRLKVMIPSSSSFRILLFMQLFHSIIAFQHLGKFF
jgi:hypothetical protein